MVLTRYPCDWTAKLRTWANARPVAGLPAPIYLGSAPTKDAANKGMRIGEWLGCVMPGGRLQSLVMLCADWQVRHILYPRRRYWYNSTDGCEAS